MPGIIKVEARMSGFEEINRVYYDPKLITVDEMIRALKKAGTFSGVKK